MGKKQLTTASSTDGIAGSTRFDMEGGHGQRVEEKSNSSDGSFGVHGWIDLEKSRWVTVCARV